MNFFKTILKSLGLAFSFLSGIPSSNKILRQNDPAWKYYTIFYPFCGAIIGYICIVITQLISSHLIFFEKTNIPTSILPSCLKAIIFLCSYYYMTRAMHFDGFCDVADALMAIGDEKKRLKALKDSCIGVGGLCAGILLLLFKFVLLSIIFNFNNIETFKNQAGYFIITSLIFSRNLVVLFSALAPSMYKNNPDKKNISSSTSELTQLRNFILGAIFFSLPSIILLISHYSLTFSNYFTLFLIIIAQLLLMIILSYKAKKYFKGINGDFLGCFIELSELLSFISIIYLITKHLAIK